MHKRFFLLIPAVVAALCSCARYDADYKLPGVYRLNIQQGNVLEQEMLDKLRPGMNKNQVRFIMGTPAINDPFHSERWDYIYTRSVNGGQRRQVHLTMYFEDEKLAYLEGDVVASMRAPVDEFRQTTKIVDVPTAQQPKKGVITRMMEALPFVGDKSPKQRKQDAAPLPENSEAEQGADDS
jgi:outer membrane protein assembly factor BamE